MWKWFKLTREQELNDIDTVYGEPKMIRVVDDPQWSPEQLAEITVRNEPPLTEFPKLAPLVRYYGGPAGGSMKD